jgi:phosphoribosylaminoimidazolecarboxamide formyltransferase / IMP cyclohydrolase
MGQIRRAVLSVFDKQGLVQLARGLRRRGVELLSSGGTASALREQQIAVTQISDYTGAPEILDGRVKTLHPRISGGILARDRPDHAAELAAHGIEPIDLVVVNLYPFSQTVARADATTEQIIEMIDIGGPTLIRAAAKNHERVAVLVDPADYAALIAELEQRDGEVSEATRRELAAKAFAHTAAYDGAVAAYFAARPPAGRAPGTAQDPPDQRDLPEQLTLALRRVQPLRYGENPHQRAALYSCPMTGAAPAIVDCEQLRGNNLSYNNILDADAALGLVLDLPRVAVAIVKHTNPCGAACTAADLPEAFRRARATDPAAAFGGVVACNQQVSEALATELKELFLEAVIAPGYDPSALEMLGRKKNLRLLRYVVGPRRSQLQLRSVSGGILVQDGDASLEDPAAARVVTRRAPSPEELEALGFGWRICKHVKSNAIVFAAAGQLVGVGAGQMSRVDAVKLAVAKAQLPLAGTALASYAFFPFRDGLDAAARAGATAVIQPGGSVRDEEVIAAADEQDVAMVFTGIRHFRH